MPIDRQRFLGYELPPHMQDVDTWRLRFFATAIGETDSVYTDLAAARAAGHSALPLPPTFIFCMEQGRADGYRLIQDMGIDISRVLHGEQHFEYHRPVHVGDTLTFKTKIIDIYEKKGGALEFFVRATSVSNQRGEHVADCRGTVVVRNIG
jgi:N-terminal half of MaoC dehydratase